MDFPKLSEFSVGFPPINPPLRDLIKEELLHIVRQNYFSASHVHSVTLGNHLKPYTSGVKEQCYLGSKDGRPELNTCKK